MKDIINSKKYDPYDRIKFFGEEKLNNIKTDYKIDTIHLYIVA